MDKLIFLGPDGYEHFVQKRIQKLEVIKAQTESSVLEFLNEATVILDAYMKVPFRQHLLDQASNLKLFVTATTGVTHVDTTILEKRNIPILTLKGQEHITGGLTAAAEHTWLLLMSVARKLPEAREEVLNGGWDRNKFPGPMFKGKTMGVIGCGRIGQWIAKYAKAFGMEVLGYDEHKIPNSDLFISRSLNSLLESSDFISINIPFTEQTKNFLSKEKFDKIKKGAYFVNTSRGEVIDETALLCNLENGRIAGAGLDVLQSEPWIDNDPLVEYSRRNTNLIITPHIGGLSPDALEIVLDFSCTRINNFLSR